MLQSEPKSIPWHARLRRGLAGSKASTGRTLVLFPYRQKQKGPQGPHLQFLAEKEGFSSLASRTPCQRAATRLRWSNRVPIPNLIRRKNKRPRKGAFCFSGGGASPPRTMLSGHFPNFSIPLIRTDSPKWNESCAKGALLKLLPEVRRRLSAGRSTGL